LEISFADKKLEKVCQNQRLLVKMHGPTQARKLRQRLDDLQAAVALDVMRRLPGRCHELTGDRAGQFALDLTHPYRLIFEPDHNPAPRKQDGGLDWTAITAVCIIGVEDYHG
jgi:plasmid maintenance system killer protein